MRISKVNNILSDFQNQFNIGKGQYEQNKADFAARSALAPRQASQGVLADSFQGVLRLAPSLVAMSADPAVAVGVGASMANDLHDEMLYKWNVPKSTADALSLSVAAVYGVGGRILGGLFPASGEAKNLAAKTFAEQAEKYLHPVAAKALTGTLETGATLEVMNAFNDAARSTAKVLGDEDESVAQIWKDHWQNIPSTLLQSAILGGVSGLAQAYRPGDNRVVTEDTGPKPGDPVKVANAERAEGEHGLDPNRELGSVATQPGQNPELDNQVAAERQRILNETEKQIADEKELNHAVQEPSTGAVGAHEGGDEGTRGTVEGQGVGQGEQGEKVAAAGDTEGQKLEPIPQAPELEAGAKGEAPVEFHSLFKSLVGKPPVEQYRMLSEMPEFSKDSTLSRQEIEKAGYTIPEEASKKAEQAKTEPTIFTKEIHDAAVQLPSRKNLPGTSAGVAIPPS